MAGINLRVANLKNANLQNCDLRGAVLAGADLENCNLSGCDLQEANLRGANLKGATFELMLNPTPHVAGRSIDPHVLLVTVQTVFSSLIKVDRTLNKPRSGFQACNLFQILESLLSCAHQNLLESNWSLLSLNGFIVIATCYFALKHQT